jgi:hypothetical protein
MGKVLGIVYRAISTHLIHKAGFQLKQGATGAVTPARPVSYSASGALSTSPATMAYSRLRGPAEPPLPWAGHTGKAR